MLNIYWLLLAKVQKVLACVELPGESDRRAPVSPAQDFEQGVRGGRG